MSQANQSSHHPRWLPSSRVILPSFLPMLITIVSGQSILTSSLDDYYCWETSSHDLCFCWSPLCKAILFSFLPLLTIIFQSHSLCQPSLLPIAHLFGWSLLVSHSTNYHCFVLVSRCLQSGSWPSLVVSPHRWSCPWLTSTHCSCPMEVFTHLYLATHSDLMLLLAISIVTIPICSFSNSLYISLHILFDLTCFTHFLLFVTSYVTYGFSSITTLLCITLHRAPSAIHFTFHFTFFLT